MNVFKREVNSSCLEFLSMEMVDVVMNLTGSTDNDFTLAAEVLDEIGFIVGQKLMERYCKDTECVRFEEQVSSASYCKELEIVKFLCKDFWQLLFKKPVNGLRTNTGPNPKYKYVLQDHNFPWLKRLSTDSPEQAKKLADRYLCYPRGIIRGALHNLGLETKVSSSVALNGPAFACSFTILTKAHLQAMGESGIPTPSPRASGSGN